MTSTILEKSSILLVDDNHELLSVLKDILVGTGKYTVFTAIDGATALEVCSQILPDCIIVDIKMPKINGYQFIRSLRGDQRYENIPMIILSAFYRDRDVLTGFLAGVDQFLAKPKTPNELIDAIERAKLVTEDDRLQRMQDLLQERPHQ